MTHYSSPNCFCILIGGIKVSSLNINLQPEMQKLNVNNTNESRNYAKLKERPDNFNGRQKVVTHLLHFTIVSVSIKEIKHSLNTLGDESLYDPNHEPHYHLATIKAD